MLTYRNDQEWRTRAACRGTDPALWDTPTHLKHDDIAIPEQLAMCKGCPVLRECAADSALARDSGTIRAGIPVAATGGVGRLRSWKALSMIATTGDVDAARKYAFADYGVAMAGAGNE